MKKPDLKSLTKICIRCKKEKLREDFHNDKSRKDGLFPYCKVCKSETRKIYYNENKDEINKKSLEWQRNNPAKRKEINRRWTKNNKDKTRLQYENNKETIIGRSMLWAKNNREKRKEISKKYYWGNIAEARETNRISRQKRRFKEKETNLTKEYLRELKEQTKFCLLCNCELNEICYHPNQYNLDHIIPLNVGGTHTKDNVRYICSKCNKERPKDGRDISS